MNIFIDTNVLFSTILFGNGIAARAYAKAVSPPNRGKVSAYVIEETRRVIDHKFPNDVWRMNKFLAEARGLQIVDTPEEPVVEETLVRDPADWPIIRAAVSAGVDILLTGDKDLLESGIAKPEIMSPAEFLSRGAAEFPKAEGE